MKLFLTVIACVLVVSSPASAQSPSPSPSPAASSSATPVTSPKPQASTKTSAKDVSRLIESIEGVYKHKIKSAMVDSKGGADIPYETEDVVEIVRYNDKAIYFRAELQFYNGHQCGLYGIAAFENGSFVYKDDAEFSKDEPKCVLTIQPTDKVIKITDQIDPSDSGSCKSYCGFRGSFSDYEIETSSKRKIRYLPRLKKSRQYGEAVTAFEKKK